MTVALYVKVFDGIVLATDSATTMKVDTPLGPIFQVYNNADKIFHLHRQLPVAGMTWGMGVVGPASISSLSKSFRLQLMGRDPGYSENPLDIDDFKVQDVAERASRMFARAAKDAKLTRWPDPPDDLGYLVAGISSDCDQAETWLLEFQGADLEPAPQQVFTDIDYGFRAYAQPEAVNRMFNGYDDSLLELLVVNTFNAKVQAGIDAGNPVDPKIARAEAEQEVDTALKPLRMDPVQSGMPLPDAIELARFMVETTEGYARYRLGPDTVGGQVEVASISPHEGFKWISRKHYFSQALNPGEQP